LHKKLAATLTISIFILSMFAVMAPAQAHFTLGSSSPVYPWTTNNFDPHVDGVIGYVWPGGGENTYLGAPTYVSSIVAPGYIAPYPAQTLAGSLFPANYLQVDAHEYAPFGAIVTGTTGDLIFAINATGTNQRQGFTGTFQEWDILIPPEFTVPGDTSNLVTTVTNNPYDAWTVGALSPYDRYAPGWTLIRIQADAQHWINFTANAPGTSGEWYYARINGVTAPTVAGKYFFKMFLTGGATGDYWVPTENWPVLLVKGELDPAIITGTIRYGGYNASLYGKPMQEAGMVTAVMTTKLDPYTNQPMPNGPLTNAVGYFNGTDTDCLDTPSTCSPEGSGGHYEVEGVAPGVYDLYASAAGYPQSLIASGVTVLKGQSLHFDGYLNPGPVIHGDVYSKHAFGAEPWPYDMYIKIELYANPTNNHVPDASAGPAVSWSPLPCVAGGKDFYAPADSAADCGDPRTVDGGIQFPWHGYTDGVGHVYLSSDNPAGTDPQGVGPAQTWFVTAGNDVFHYEFGAKGQYGAPTQLDGHVPQVYATWVNGLTPGRYYARAWVFRYVQSALDGSTFQEYSFEVSSSEWAGDISLPIDLRISSWINKTVHFHDRAGTLSTDAINTGAEYLEGALYDAVTGVMYAYNATTIGTPTRDVTTSGSPYVPLDPLNLYCNDYTHAEFGSCNIKLYGINDTWLGENYGIPAGTYKPVAYALGYIQQTQDLVSVTLSGTPIQVSNHLYRGVGFNFTVYSIDWERPRVNRNWVWPGAEIDIAMYNSTLAFVDAYSANANSDPGANQESSTYYVEVEGTGLKVQTGTGTYDDALGVFFGHPTSSHLRVGGSVGGSSIFTSGGATNTWALSFKFDGGFDSGQYSFQGWTYGYIQDKDYTVYANKGEIADIKINLLIGVNVTVDILFKKEGLISRTPYDMSARVRVFDDSGMLVGEWMSSEGVNVTSTANAVSDQYPYDGVGLNYVPAGVSNLRVNIAGLPMFYGDPVFTGYGCDFGLDCFSPDYWSTPGAIFPNEGILGSPDYTGTGWTVEVDFVNWYLNGTVDSSNNPYYMYYDHVYYPVVPGLLMGESYHIIPGTTATSGISLTEDGAVYPGHAPAGLFLDHSMAMNHLGPYSQQAVWSLPNAHLSGEVSGVWEVDLNGYVTGTALAFTWSNEFRPISWYTVTVTGASGMAGSPFTAYTNDGIYEFYLTPGTYSMTLAGPGYAETPMGSIAVTAGQGGNPGSGNNIGLPPTNIPVPEFSGLAVVAFSALAASLYLLRRKRR
jgi:hypothetical protein